MDRASERVRVWRYRHGEGLTESTDDAAGEEPLEIRVNGRAIAVTMRTPGHDEELAAGFLRGEGVVARAAEIEHIRRCDKAAGESIDVLLAATVRVDFESLTRHVFASSSCGVCGSSTIDAVRKKFPPVDSDIRIPAAVIEGLAESLRQQQTTFDKTGGLHAAGLFDESGSLVTAREDVGRHNAVDKVIGRGLLDGRLPLHRSVLMVSGRASFEIVQKSLAAGIPILAAVSAPSSLAVDLAEEGGLTLIGFLRQGRFNVYTHPGRIAAGGAGR